MKLKRRQHLLDLVSIASVVIWLLLIWRFDSQLFGLVSNSLKLAGMTSLLVVPLGVLIAFFLTRTNMPGKSFLGSLIVGLLALPLILILSAWDAGFGRLGWLQWWLNGDFSGRTIDGMPAAVLVHAAAALPWTIFLGAVSLSRQGQASFDAARLDATKIQLLSSLLVRQLIPAGGLALGWVFLQCFGEMIVTDLYRVRTYAEEIYVSMPYGQALWFQSPNSLQSVSPDQWLLAPTHLGLLCCLCLLASNWTTRLFEQIRWWWNDSAPLEIDLGPQRKWLVALPITCLLLMLTGVPLTNLVIKSGFVAMPEGEQVVVQWSVAKVINQLLGVPIRFADEFVWSLLIAIATSSMVVPAAILLSWISRLFPVVRNFVVFVTSFMWILPGPLIGLILITCLNHDWPLLNSLYDRSILAPVLACSIKVFPIAICIALAIQMSVPNDQLDLASAEGIGRFSQLRLIVIPQRKLAILGTLLAVFVLAFGELSACLLVIPPGMETVPRRIYGLLHAGVDDQAASLCLFQWLILFVAAALFFVCFAGKSKTDNARI